MRHFQGGFELKSRGSAYLEYATGIFIACVFAGYPALALTASVFGIDADNSRLVTVPFRGAMLTMSLVILAGSRLWIAGARRPGAVLLGIFWSLYCLRILWETVYHPDTLSIATEYLWSYALGVCCVTNLPMLLPVSSTTQQIAPRGIWGLALYSSILSLLGNPTGVDLEQRLTVSELLNPISQGQSAVTLILAAVYLALTARGSLGFWVFAASALPGFYIVAAAGSRSPVLSLIGGLAILSWWGRGIRMANRLAVLGVGVSFVVSFGVSYLIARGSALTTRVEGTLAGIASGEDMDRFSLWRMAWSQYLGSPIVGDGVEIFGVGYPHNLVIESLMVLGPLGLVIFLLIHLRAVRGLSLAVNAQGMAWLGALAAQFFVLSMFTGGLYCSPEFWAALMGLLTISDLGRRRPV